MQQIRFDIRKKIVVSAIVSSLFFSLPSIAQMPDSNKNDVSTKNVPFNFALPSGNILKTAGKISSLTGQQIILEPDIASSLQTPEIEGSYTLTALLNKLLPPLGLSYRQVSENTIVIKHRVEQSKSSQQPTSPQYMEKPDDIETIVVTGSYTVQSMNGATGLHMALRETPQSVSIVTSQMIDDFALNDMVSLLKNVPGISVRGNASEQHDIFVRGFKMDAGIQVDGMMTKTAASGTTDPLGQSIDPVIAERVEVLKGAAGILSGMGEPSATVNMIRKRPTADTQAYVLGRVGRWDTYRVEADVSGSLNSSGSIRGRAVAAYQDNDTFRDNYASEKSIFYGIVESDLSDFTRMSVSLDYVDSDNTGAYTYSSNPAFFTDGTPLNAPRSFNTAQPWHYSKANELSAMTELQHEFSNGWNLHASYRYSDGDLDGMNGGIGPLIDKETGAFYSPYADGGYISARDRTSRTESINMYMTGDFELFSKEHEFVAGYSSNSNKLGIDSRSYEDAGIYNYYTGAYLVEPDFSSPDSVSYSREKQTQEGYYGTLRFHVSEPLTIMAGGRVSNWENIRYGDISLGGISQSFEIKDDNIYTPYAGIVYDINSYASVYSSYTGIFLPVRSRGADGMVLPSTEGLSYEAGVKLAFYDNRLNISSAVYRSEKDNVAQFANLGRLPSGDWIYMSIDGVKTDGFEVEIAGEITPRWNINAGYTYNDAEDESGTPRDTQIPQHLFKLTSIYQLTGSFEGLSVGASIKWQNSTYEDSGSLTVPDGSLVSLYQEQPAYTLVDLMANYRVSESLLVALNVTNLFDETYNRSMWGYSDYGEPLNIAASVRWNF